MTEVLAHGEVDTQDVLEIIRPDPAMTAKLLQLVNSAFFGLPRQISDAREAIVFLGLGMIRDLLAAADVFQSFADDTRLPQDLYTTISAQGARVAETCAFLAERSANVSIAGLLHDIGLLVLAVCRPDPLATSLERSRREGTPLHVVETELIGTTHGAVGAYMLSLWGFPYETVEAVANHHDARSLPPEARLAHVLHVAGALNGEADTREGCTMLEPATDLDEAYVERLGLTARVAGGGAAAQARVLTS